MSLYLHLNDFSLLKLVRPVQSLLVSTQSNAYVLHWLEINWLCTCRLLLSDPCLSLRELLSWCVKRAVAVLVFPCTRRPGP